VNTAIKKLRRALGDDAHGPRFIETLPGRGYRFTASVSTCARAPQRARAFRSLAEEFSARAAVGAPLTSRELAALRQLLDASSAAPASESGAPFPHAA
jgi:DNA-binding winged helix-turn-helix (wHTH) protein